ncbi:hypothetical protein TWF718_003488 [Orbilia javanica]|uniref:Uncharacterized protein n=1 Tax=Orbilia javanica TaxID=47235 RepID=A0AAN8RJ29_9PEZI
MRTRFLGSVPQDEVAAAAAPLPSAFPSESSGNGSGEGGPLLARNSEDDGLSSPGRGQRTSAGDAGPVAQYQGSQDDPMVYMREIELLHSFSVNRTEKGGQDSEKESTSGSDRASSGDGGEKEAGSPPREEDYEEVVPETTDPASGRYWEENSARNLDGSFRWPGIHY